MRWWMCRLGAAAACLVCLAGLVEVVQLLQVSDPPSVLMTVAGIGMALTALLLLLASVAPRSWWQSAIMRVTHWIESLRAATPCGDAAAGRALFITGLLTFAVMSGRLLTLPIDPWDDDQGAFLATAREVQRDGGPVGLMRDLFAGHFAEANRHPLYIGLLSLQPTVMFGRGLSTAIGCLTLVTLSWLSSRRWGIVTGGLTCVLMATNLAFLLFSTRVVCDILMVLWGGLIWLALPVQGPTSPRRSLLVGVLTGLAWLTKGTGLLLLAGVVMLKLWELCRKQSDASRRDIAVSLVLIVIGWGMIASPLLVRNVVRFGSPLYNVNTWLLFTDSYEDPQALSEFMTSGEAARRYFGTHSAAVILAREVSGLVWETFILLRKLGPSPLDDARVLPGFLLALLGAAGMFLIDRSRRRQLVVWMLIFVAVFAWYVPVAAGERFLLPLLGPVLMCAAIGLNRLFACGPDRNAQHSGSGWIVIASGLWCAVWVVLTFLSTTLPGRL